MLLYYWNNGCNSAAGAAAIVMTAYARLYLQGHALVTTALIHEMAGIDASSG